MLVVPRLLGERHQGREGAVDPMPHLSRRQALGHAQLAVRPGGACTRRVDDDDPRQHLRVQLVPSTAQGEAGRAPHRPRLRALPRPSAAGCVVDRGPGAQRLRHLSQGSLPTLGAFGGLREVPPDGPARGAGGHHRGQAPGLQHVPCCPRVRGQPCGLRAMPRRPVASRQRGAHEAPHRVRQLPRSPPAGGREGRLSDLPRREGITRPRELRDLPRPPQGQVVDPIVRVVSRCAERCVGIGQRRAHGRLPDLPCAPCGRGRVDALRRMPYRAGVEGRRGRRDAPWPMRVVSQAACILSGHRGECMYRLPQGRHGRCPQGSLPFVPSTARLAANRC